MVKCRNYWTKEKCVDEAKLYNCRKDFSKKSKGSYESSRKNGWLDEICEHMITYYVVSDWTKEKCLEVSKKCKTVKDFYTKYNSAYQSCVRNGWLNDIIKKLERNYKQKGYWTKEKCIEASLSCKNKKEFKSIYSTAYCVSVKNKWLYEIYDICNFNNNYNKIWMIYSYIILNKYVYVGITINEKSRKTNHLNNDKNSSVNKFIKNNNIDIKDIIYKKEEENVTNIEDVKKFEEDILNKYCENGLIKINLKKTGNLGGGNLIWNKERCIEASMLCDTKKEFRKKYNSAYNSSRKEGWISEIYTHIKKDR